MRHLAILVLATMLHSDLTGAVIAKNPKDKLAKIMACRKVTALIDQPEIIEISFTAIAVQFRSNKLTVFASYSSSRI